jgi:hypothetical protein
VDRLGRWFRQHWVPIATGAAGFGIGCVVGWVHIGDGTLVWGTAGEWVGGIGATLAVGWAVWAFLQEREANKRRYAELVAVVGRQWRPAGDENEFDAYVEVLNGGPVDIDQVVVYADVNGARAWAAESGSMGHRLWPRGSKGYMLTWNPRVTGEQRPILPTVIFQDVTLTWWSRALGEPPERLTGPPREALEALAEADARRAG